jgi:flagellar hook assembly protein FlgD
MQSKTAFVIDSPYKNANHIIDIYNIKGQKVRSLNQDAKNPNRIEWNKKDEHQNILSSGIYFYRIRNEEHSSSFKKLSIIN